MLIVAALYPNHRFCPFLTVLGDIKYSAGLPEVNWIFVSGAKRRSPAVPLAAAAGRLRPSHSKRTTASRPFEKARDRISRQWSRSGPARRLAASALDRRAYGR